MSTCQRLFCCCLPYKRVGDQYEPLITKGIPVIPDPPLNAPPQPACVAQHAAFTSPLVHVHVMTNQAEVPFSCCQSKGLHSKEKSSIKEPERKDLLKFHQSDDAIPLYTSSLPWTLYSEDMKTCQEKGNLRYNKCRI